MAQSQPAQSKATEKGTPQIEISRQDQFMQRKQGQYTAETEARLREARESSASRAEPQTPYQPEPYTDTWLRVKQGVVRSK
jgi:hypothetical protein